MSNQLIPYLCARDAAKAVEFYQRAFGAEPGLRIDMPDGKVGHVQLAIGDARFYLAEEYPEIGCQAPAEDRGAAVTLHLVIDDVDAFVARATAAGAKLDREPRDEFYGLRAAILLDPFGHRWMIASEIEKLSDAEVLRRAEKFHGGGDQ